jgi:hypothetical protein
LTRTATGRDAASGGSGADEEGTFREFHRDERGRVIDSDGNPVAAPENGWVAEMEKEWAATGYDERFFDDDWDEINPANVNAETQRKRTRAGVPVQGHQRQRVAGDGDLGRRSRG